MRLPAALLPLKGPVFRGLCIASLAANLTMWMNDVAAAWLMTSLTANPVLVALVQTASSLPVFLLGVPSGAVADIVDKRRYFAATQAWVLLIAALLAVLSLAGLLSASTLLVLTALNGIGLAMRWPVFSAIVPRVVSREDLPAALALNGVSINLSRVIGPVVAGALISLVSPTAVFVVNALLSALSFWLILRWRSVPQTSTLPGERFVGALRAGVGFMFQSPRLKVVLVRIVLFYVQMSALMALLPLIARRISGGGPATFTVMLACVGAGGIVAALYLPRWRARFSRDQLVSHGTFVNAACSVIVVLVPEVWVALPAMFVVGVAWVAVANSLTVSAQMALPDWVRARGMSMYQTALMGGSAGGAMLWGQVAAWSDVRWAVVAAAIFGVLVLIVIRRHTVDGGVEMDFTPTSARQPPTPVFPIAADDGPVMVTIDYLIDPANAAAFAEVMQRTRQARLRQGALSWGLFRDAAHACRYIEYFVDENWVEHQRRLDRFTVHDAELRDQRLALHVGGQPPEVKRYVADSLHPVRWALP